MDYSIKDKVAIVGIGETQYYKAGQSPVSEFQLALEAIQKAVADAGLRVEDIDGFASYSDDRNDPTRLAGALGIPQIQFSNMHWGGGGGGMAGAVGNAAAAIVAGYAKHVVAFAPLPKVSLAALARARWCASEERRHCIWLPRAHVSGADVRAASAMSITLPDALCAFPLPCITMHNATRARHVWSPARVAYYNTLDRQNRSI
jgi:hypothetical protein